MNTSQAKTEAAETRRHRGSDEGAVVLAARSGGEQEQLVATFLPKIATMARDYRGVRAVGREELIQAGVLGLLRALERYECERANTFWTYARWWVRQAMQELVSSLNNVVVLSDRALRQLARVNAARRAAIQSRRAEPSRRELAAVTGVPSSRIGRLVGVSQPAFGLDETFREDGRAGRPAAETLADPRSGPRGHQVRQRARGREVRHRRRSATHTLPVTVKGGQHGIPG
jgi:DNA-directed RNA polymerase sigma subunit (sigma70/sigma32)